MKLSHHWKSNCIFSLSLSLSLSIYIYIYIYTHTRQSKTLVQIYCVFFFLNQWLCDGQTKCTGLLADALLSNTTYSCNYTRHISNWIQLFFRGLSRHIMIMKELYTTRFVCSYSAYVTSTWSWVNGVDGAIYLIPHMPTRCAQGQPYFTLLSFHCQNIIWICIKTTYLCINQHYVRSCYAS